MTSSRTGSAASRARAAAVGALAAAYERAVRDDRVRRLLYSVRNRRLFGGMDQHDDMLADRIRIDAYHAAISRHVGPGDVVVDLGTGSGVLACFAARAGAERVHAIEHSPMAEAAQAVVRDNGIETVEVHRVHSSAFELPERADVLVHEQIGEALFDERVVENVADLRDRVLKPGGRILPGVLHLYVEPVQLREDARRPFAWQHRLHGIDFRALEPFARDEPPSYRYTVLRPFPLERLLSDPEPLVTVDLHTVQAGDLPARIAWRRRVTADGVLDGLAAFFAADFDDELSISSNPADPATHWGAPLLRMEPREVRAGDELELELTAAPLSAPETWRWSVTVHPGARGAQAQPAVGVT